MEATKSLYVDTPSWGKIEPDDFIVAVGKTKSNSVYHVAESRGVPRPGQRITRYYLKVYNSDLITALRRDRSQQLIPVTWYQR